ncbi:hypothetical protein FNV43_RR10176 [Rhamnella rubrinervis]|uniref:Uncharacterized protein n=1 Tax=Rhamnella rubrinervis TaxID=2594499 RepID=A0A8K0HC57_9ROSA|nr:hypothetical protein FNV43_RR10176 [Rhamnella rubrinervis]
MGGNTSSTSTSTSSSGLREMKQCMPMDLALKEASFKGSLLGRVASLEHRLSQLCLEMESSSGKSRTSSCTTTCTHTSGDNSSQGSKGEPSCSFPTFNTSYAGNIRPTPQTHFTRIEIQEDSNRDQQKQKHPSPPKQKPRKNRPNNDEKSYKRGKLKTTRGPPTWPHFKLLGC